MQLNLPDLVAGVRTSDFKIPHTVGPVIRPLGRSRVVARSKPVDVGFSYQKGQIVTDPLVYTGAVKSWNASRQYSGDFLTQVDLALGNHSQELVKWGTSVSSLGLMVMCVTDIDAFRELYAGTRPGFPDVWARHMGRHFPAMGVIGVSSLPDPQAKVSIHSFATRPNVGVLPLELIGRKRGYHDVAVMDDLLFSGGTVGWTKEPTRTDKAEFPTTLAEQMRQGFANIHGAFTLAGSSMRNTGFLLMFVTDPSEYDDLIESREMDQILIEQFRGIESIPPVVVVASNGLVEPDAKVEIFAVARK